MKPLRVLSLFDGISCGQVALERAGIPVEVYYASEIDKYAIQITQKNYPNTIQLGDVTKIDFTQFINKIDLIMGGSPCQDLSIAGKRAGLQGERSGLFYKFVEAIETIKPKYFLLENNVGMPQDAYEEISRLMGCYPIEINSALVSAQTRKRYYWTNIGDKNYNLFGFPTVAIPQPKNKGILLKDVLESGYAPNDKSRCIQSSIGRTTTREYFKKNQNQMVAELLGNINPSGKGQNGNIYGVNSKSPTITCNKGEGIKILESAIYQLPRGYNDGGIKKYKTPALTTSQWEYNNLLVSKVSLKIPENTVKGYAEIQQGECMDLTHLNSKTRRGRAMKEKCNCLQTQSEFYQYLKPICINSQSGRKDGKAKQPSLQDRIYSVKGKSISMCQFQSNYKIDLPDGEYLIRKLTPIECERLQTLPDNFTEYGTEGKISNIQRYKAIGNGWTVDVIAHIFSFIQEEE